MRISKSHKRLSRVLGKACGAFAPTGCQFRPISPGHVDTILVFVCVRTVQEYVMKEESAEDIGPVLAQDQDQVTNILSSPDHSFCISTTRHTTHHASCIMYHVRHPPHIAFSTLHGTLRQPFSMFLGHTQFAMVVRVSTSLRL